MSQISDKMAEAHTQDKTSSTKKDKPDSAEKKNGIKGLAKGPPGGL